LADSTQKRKIRAAEEFFVVAFFLFAVSLPLGLLLLRGEGRPAWENRRLAEFPARPRSLGEAFHLPRMLTEYFKDHFALRPELIRVQAVAKVGRLGASSSPEVLLGKDGWLFLAGEGEVEMFTGSAPFKAEELERWRLLLESLRDRAARRGAVFVVTFVPEKQTIYPELMPDALTRPRGPSRQDQLIEYLKARSDVRVVDLRPALLEAKAAGQIYLRTDTHWNRLGSFAAYGALAREIGKDFGAVRPTPTSELEVAHETYSGDLAGMLGLRGVDVESVPRLLPRRPARARFEGNCGDVGRCASVVEGETLPRLLMYRDSAASALIPFLAEHFGRAVYVWDRKWGFSDELMEKERPDVLMLEMVERRLMDAPPAPPEDSGAAETRAPGEARAEGGKQ
jgi:alginate O-acetyltransferase complex protein AlgJ